jgi:hypothetical protein
VDEESNEFVGYKNTEYNRKEGEKVDRGMGKRVLSRYKKI